MYGLASWLVCLVWAIINQITVSVLRSELDGKLDEFREMWLYEEASPSSWYQNFDEDYKRI
jgi:hypothetical protein